MEVVSPPKVRKLLEIDFVFLGDVKTGITLDEGRGDVVRANGPDLTIILKNEDGSTRETIDVFARNLLYTSTRRREVEVLDPKNDPVKQVVAEHEKKFAHLQEQ